MTTLESVIQSPEPGAVIELFVLDATALGGTISRFHAGRNVLEAAVVWQGETYTPFPIEASGFERNARGTLPRPKLVVANANGIIGLLVHTYDDLVGAQVTRKRTLGKYLDAVNFVGGVNADADPTAGWLDEVWYIDRKSAETKSTIEFELAAPWDVAGIVLPRRPVIANVCAWLAIGGYRGAQCGYAGGAVAQADDTPTDDIALDRCGGRPLSCALRFGADGELPYGSFPSAGLVR